MKKIVVANWKMNPDTAEKARELYRGIKKVAVTCSNVTTVVCPPAVYVAKLAPAKNLFLGVQNVFGDRVGAYTGETSPSMAKSVGAEYVILGHSERRRGKLGVAETDEMINAKLFYSLKEDLTAILCVGESQRDEQGEYLKTLATQIAADLPKLRGKQTDQLIVAYEPLWSIGEGAERPATTEECMAMAIFIRKELINHMPRAAALRVPILYGGSVDVANAESFLRHGGVQGLLVGRDSLNASTFGTILEIANKVR